MEKAKARAIKRVVGDPFKSGVEQGPQVSMNLSELAVNLGSNKNNRLSFSITCSSKRAYAFAIAHS